MSVNEHRKLRTLILDCLSGKVREWPCGDSQEAESHFLALSEEMEVQPMLHVTLAGGATASAWPESILKQLKAANLAQFAGFELRLLEIRKVLAMLKSIGVDPVLLKGIPFSLSIYPHPHHRPSSDTDLLVPGEKLSLIGEKMVELGYEETPDLLFSTVSQQKQFCREARSGLEHIFEFHLRTNNRSLLAPFDYEYFNDRSETVVFEGLEFRTPQRPEAFYMAGLHRAGHLKNDRRFLWCYDLKLLAIRMEDDDWDRLMAFATENRCRALIAEELIELAPLACGALPREVSAWAERWCEERSEVSSYYLRSNRTRRSDLVMGIRSLPSISLRFRTLLLLLFPRSSYMRQAYRI